MIGTPALLVVEAAAEVEELEAEEVVAEAVVEATPLEELAAPPMCIPSWVVMEDTRFCINSGGGAEPPAGGGGIREVMSTLFI